MFRSYLVVVASLITYLSLSVVGQTSGELRQKYQITSAVESFEVRRGITATVFYDENGQAVEILVRPRLFYAHVASAKEMPFSIFEEILAEFAPVAKRGKLCNETDSISGRNHYVHATYENVYMNSVIHNRGADHATASMMRIRWEQIRCSPASSKPWCNNGGIDFLNRFEKGCAAQPAALRPLVDADSGS